MEGCNSSFPWHFAIVLYTKALSIALQTFAFLQEEKPDEEHSLLLFGEHKIWVALESLMGIFGFVLPVLTTSKTRRV